MVLLIVPSVIAIVSSQYPIPLYYERYTIAVLYAKQQAFAFSDPGVRHRDPAFVEVYILFLSSQLNSDAFLIYLLVSTVGLSTIVEQFAYGERPSPEISGGITLDHS